MRKVTHILFLIALLITGALTARVQADSPRIAVLRASGTVNPVLADYIKRGITQAESENAAICIIQLDTPGGLDTAMRDIVQSIVNARVPVVVYVSPSGARAASAGVFITIAAHVAVMSPNTAIGAASPIALGPGGEEELATMKEKILNDATAYVRSLAQARGRNIEWAEKAVREAVSATAEEALSLHVIDLIAPNLDVLISELNGREVTMLDGSKVTLTTQGAAIKYIDMTTAENFLFILANPNIAFILLSLAALGIIVAIYSPSLIFPGIIGAISGLLAFYILGLLPVNYAGLLLIILAFGLFIAEALTPGFGLLTAGGIASLTIGSMILFKGESPLLRVNPWLIAAVVVIIAAIFVFVISKVIKARHQPIYTGREELMGKTARVRTALEPEGLAFYGGELWRAVSESGRVEPGEEVLIDRIDGLTLYVTKKSRGGN